MKNEWEKITDPNRKLTEEDHGRILKVGKRHFRRIVFPNLPKFWETGHDGIVKTVDGYKSYKLKKENKETLLLISN